MSTTGILLGPGNIVTAIADPYDSASTYTEGSFCVQDGKVYECTSAISTPEVWNAAHWQRIKVMDKIAELTQVIRER